MVPSIRQSRSNAALQGRKNPLENRSVHGYQWTWNLCGRGGMWKARMWKINFIGAAPFSEIAVVKTEKRQKNLSAGILFYPGFCSGVSGE